MKCIVLAGGGGLRLWPLSTRQKPKQFLKITSDKSMIQETIIRNKNFFDKCVVITNEEYCDLTEKNLSEIEGLDYQILLETMGRNTAPAIAIAALLSNPDDVLFVVPADAKIEPSVEYTNAVLKAKELAEQDAIVTFGVAPTYAHTGYGYIKYKDNEVIEFKEKPDEKTALKYLECGDYLWNCGMFMFKSKVLLSELSKYRNDIYSACVDLVNNLKDDKIQVLKKEYLEKIPSESIDYAVMEKSDKIKVVPSMFKWSDIGGLESLCETVVSDEIVSNKIVGENVIVNGCQGTDVANFAKDKLIVINDVEDIVVACTDNAIYISKKGKSQEIKNIIEKNKGFSNFF